MNALIEQSLQLSLSTYFTRDHKLFIDGAWVDAEDGGMIVVTNPATGEPLGKVQAAGRLDVDRAVRAARQAFDWGPWPRLPPQERARLMFKLADAIASARDEIAHIESLDNGMPLSSGIRAAGLAVSHLSYFASWCGKLAGQIHNAGQADMHVYSVKEPVGVVGAITPWNFPFVMEIAKVAQALAAGCTVVLKPAELTPFSALKLGELVQAVDFPKGVINIVPGYGDPAGKALVEHELVDKISFTGSTAVGKWILGAAAGNLKRVTLELGGKSPTIIFPDADLAKAIPGAAMHVFANSGQVCAAASRLFVHRKVFDQVLEGVGHVAKSLRVAPGLEPGCQLGPLASQRQLERVMGYIASGIEEGAQVVQGGNRIGERGYFVQPTVVSHARRDMRFMREEIFGPVVAAVPFEDEDLNAIAEQANDTRYGLAAFIWSSDISKVHRLASKIKAGTIHVNGGLAMDPAIPFGGYKESGWGREFGAEGVEAYLETKSVVVRL